MAFPARTIESGECRQCCAFCDRVLHPAGCLASGCRYLYFYDDDGTGTRYMGCLNKVFKVEIDVRLFEEAERTRHGYGGVKLSRAPLAQCRTSVERAYAGNGEPFECVNPGFFTPPPGPASTFDLRDAL